MKTERLPPCRPDSVKAIIREVAAAHGMDPLVLLGECRRAKIVEARWAAIRRVRAEIKIAGKPPNSAQIGRWFQRDRTSIKHALEQRR